jgi:hypothetical protein
MALPEYHLNKYTITLDNSNSESLLIKLRDNESQAIYYAEIGSENLTVKVLPNIKFLHQILCNLFTQKGNVDIVTDKGQPFLEIKINTALQIDLEKVEEDNTTSRINDLENKVEALIENNKMSRGKVVSIAK